MTNGELFPWVPEALPRSPSSVRLRDSKDHPISPTTRGRRVIPRDGGTRMPETTSAASATEPTTEAATETDPTTQGEPADLGEGGKKALDAERTARKAAEKTATELQKQLDEINRANESAIERAQREAKEAQESAAKATADALRFRVAAKHGISEEDADLFLTGTDEATLARQAARLVERTPTSPLPDPTQGGKGGSAPALNSNALEQALKNKLGIS